MNTDVTFLRERGCLASPKIIQIEITNVCPLDCPQCYKDFDQMGFMNLKDFKTNINYAVENGIKAVVLIGGEPLVHINFMEMIEYLYEKNMHITIYSSGWGLDQDMVAKMSKYMEKMIFFISLNGSVKEIHNKSRDGYDISVHAMKLLCECKFEYYINWVARKDNIMHFPNLLEFVEQKSALGVNIVCNKIDGKGIVNEPLLKDDIDYLVNIMENYHNKGFVKVPIGSVHIVITIPLAKAFILIKKYYLN